MDALTFEIVKTTNVEFDNPILPVHNKKFATSFIYIAKSQSSNNWPKEKISQISLQEIYQYWGIGLYEKSRAITMSHKPTLLSLCINVGRRYFDNTTHRTFKASLLSVRLTQKP